VRATTARPNGKLLTIAQATQEYGLPERLWRDLILRGDLAAIQPPNIRRVFIVRADLERKLEMWRVRDAL
jgi:hypothetical protein